MILRSVKIVQLVHQHGFQFFGRQQQLVFGYANGFVDVLQGNFHVEVVFIGIKQGLIIFILGNWLAWSRLRRKNVPFWARQRAT